jgi:hypothetical protein
MIYVLLAVLIIGFTLCWISLNRIEFLLARCLGELSNIAFRAQSADAKLDELTTISENTSPPSSKSEFDL